MSEKDLDLSFDERLMQKERKQRNLQMKKEKQRLNIRTNKKSGKNSNKMNFKSFSDDYDDDSWYE